MDVLKEFDQVIDVIIQIEMPFMHRHGLRISPICDVNFSRFQHALDSAAQQRGVVPAHRCHDQQFGRIFRQAFTCKTFKIAEWPVDDRCLDDRESLAAQFNLFNTKSRLFVIGCGMSEHF